MTREAEGRSAGRRLALAAAAACCLAALASCQAGRYSGAVPLLRPFDPGWATQEGEVTVPDGETVEVRYKKVYAAAPRVVVLQCTQSSFREKPYRKGDFEVVQETAAGFKVRGDHPEQRLNSWATLKWRADGPLAAVQPAAEKTAQALTLEWVKRVGGKCAPDPPSAEAPVTTLDLHGAAVTDADLERLRGLTGLRTLNLSGTRVTDAGLKAVAALPVLKTLYLNDTAVGDAGLPSLKGMKFLQELSVYRTGVTDAGLADLAALPDLRDLTVGGPRVTDRGLAALKEARGLKHLGLCEAAVTAQGVRGLEQARPHLQVIQ